MLPGTIVGGDPDADAQISRDGDGALGYLRFCPGVSGFDFVYVEPSVDPIDLIPGARDRATAQLPIPTPIMNPEPAVGSVVNLGVWFAIEDPGSATARATLGTAWAEVTGTFNSVTVDPGDGSPSVTCQGFGTPYPEGSNDPDEGPCGHTYLQRTPDDDPHRMTYTITYDISWRTSNGRSGSLGTYDRSLTFDYDINEIQTVGAGA
jgi:hypothetical protein